jgi:hypothetical protein
MELLKTLIEFGCWPAAVLILGLFYRKIILDIIPKKDLEIALPGGIILKLTTKEAEKKLTELFNEFHFEYQALLRPEHKSFFQDLLSRKPNNPNVNELFIKHFGEQFDRNNEKHIGTLRALRGLGLIRPMDGGPWNGNSLIEITKFGNALTEKLSRDNML